MPTLTPEQARSSTIEDVRRRNEAAEAALGAFVDAAVRLEVAWERLGPFDVLSETCPPGHPEFTEYTYDLIMWRDRVKAALHDEEGTHAV